jgi:putative addiction module component (TIGR02574 family)
MSLMELPQIQHLSSKEKLELVKEIWISIDDYEDDLAISSEEKSLLDSRWASHIADPSSAIDLDELKARMLKRL